METTPIVLGPDILHDLPRALALEWILPNGLGGYASQSVSGVSTRRYHALLMAAAAPPSQRRALLTALDDALEGAPLATHEYPDAFFPEGYRSLLHFSLSPAPTWVFQVGERVVARRVEVPEGHNATRITYFLLQGEPATLSLRPLFAFREDHALRRREGEEDIPFSLEGDILSLTPETELLPCVLHLGGASFTAAPDWFYRFVYSQERAEGLPFEEDLFSPGVISRELRQDAPYSLWATASREPPPELPPSEPPPLSPPKPLPKPGFSGPFLIGREMKRRRSLRALYEYLSEAARAFLVQRKTASGEGKSILAGYPWLGELGRDTFTALPGLCLATGRFDEARAVLTSWVGFLQDGLLPSRFPDDGGPPEYMAADVSLWFIWAAERYAFHSRDFDFILSTLWPVFCEIIHRYATPWVEDTPSEDAGDSQRSRLGVGTDGLLRISLPGGALTWMDARTKEGPVTPRAGAPIELQALWANALAISILYADRASAPQFKERCEELLSRLMGSVGCFVRRNGEGLFDVVGPDDPSIRPNQLLAISLPYSLFSGLEARRIVDVVRQHLLTPRGLRTLSPQDPSYHPRYEGGPEERALAYHQGTVFPWLLGPYGSAYLKAYGRDNAGARFHVEDILLALTPHIREAGLGSISEIFDGDAPHTPRGCPAQARSVAEPLRLLHEELGFHP